MLDLVTPWPLVGRDREPASFAAAWAARHCRAVVICGPAGHDLHAMVMEKGNGKRLAAVEEGPGSVTAKFEDGSTAVGGVLIGEDGVHPLARTLTARVPQQNINQVTNV